MPELKSPQQEKFSKLIALEKKTQTDALKSAYPTCLKWRDESIYSKASQIANDIKVKERIKELKDILNNKVITKIVYSHLESFKELERLKEMALHNKGNTGKADLGAAIKAEELRGKLARLYEETINIKKDFGEETEYL